MSNLDPLKILYHVVNIALLFVFFRFLLYKPIMKFLNKRRDKINSELDGAAKAEEDAKEKLEKYDGLLAHAESESRNIADRMLSDAKKESESVVSEAKNQANAILRNAAAEKDAQMQKAREEIKRESVALAVEIAKKILEKEMTEADQREMIDRYVDKL